MNVVDSWGSCLCLLLRLGSQSASSVVALEPALGSAFLKIRLLEEGHMVDETCEVLVSVPSFGFFSTDYLSLAVDNKYKTILMVEVPPQLPTPP